MNKISNKILTLINLVFLINLKLIKWQNGDW